MFNRTGVAGSDDIGFEMRLPQAWTGRCFYRGKGGLDGAVATAVGAAGGGPLTHALSEGFAVISDGFLDGAPGLKLPKAAVAQLWGAQQWAKAATPGATTVAHNGAHDGRCLSPQQKGILADTFAGAKVMVYHGVADGIFSFDDSVAWYRSVAAAQGGDASDFARLFVVPGMNPCSGGPSTDQFDMLTPRVQWVEEGKAPDMRHGGVGCGPVPVAHVRRDAHHVAFADGLDRSTLALHPSRARSDDQRLPERVGVPVGTSPGHEADLARRGPVGARRREAHLQPHLPREVGRRCCDDRTRPAPRDDPITLSSTGRPCHDQREKGPAPGLHATPSFSDAMSMTKRYFTSAFCSRSHAALTCCIGMTSTSAVMPWRPQTSSISWVSAMPPMFEPDTLRLPKISAKDDSASGLGGAPTSVRLPSSRSRFR